MSLTRKLIRKLMISISLPSSLGIALLYLASVAGSEDGKWLFRMGITLLVLAFVCGRVTWIAHGQRVLEDRIAEVTRDYLNLEKKLQDTRAELSSEIATVAFDQSFVRNLPRPGSRHLRAAGEER